MIVDNSLNDKLNALQFVGKVPVTAVSYRVFQRRGKDTPATKAVLRQTARFRRFAIGLRPGAGHPELDGRLQPQPFAR